MYCKSCGKQLNDEAKFCKYCGEIVVKDDSANLTQQTKNEEQNQSLKKKSWFEKYKPSNIDLKTAEKHIKNAFIAGIVSIIISIVMILLGMAESVFWFDIAIFSLLVFGLYLKNKISAIVLVIYFLIGKITQILDGGLSFYAIILGLVFLHYFYLGALGVIKYNKIAEKKKSFTANLIFGILIGVIATAFIGYLIFQNYRSSIEGTIPTEQDILNSADYDEGYKAGYADGRSVQGQLGDNFIPPATGERKDVYRQGYLDGFLSGCNEGNFDCSEIESQIREANQENPYPIRLQ